MFVNGKLEGEGSLSQHKEGYEWKYLYQGNFVGSLKQGKGKEINEKGETYEGLFNRDKKEGKGKQTLTNGSIYEGHWVNDCKNGPFKVTNKTKEGTRTIYKNFLKDFPKNIISEADFLKHNN